MSQKTIMICDICGVEKCSGVNHWSDCVCNITLSFKEHVGVQTVPLDKQDVCTNCAFKLSKALTVEIERLKNLEAPQ